MMKFLVGGMIIATPLNVRTILENFLLSGPLSLATSMVFTKALAGIRTSNARAQFRTKTDAKLVGAEIS